MTNDRDLIVNAKIEEIKDVTVSANIQAKRSISTSVDVSSAGGGTKDHNKLINRDIANQHPISAITGLEDEITELHQTDSNNYNTLNIKIDNTKTDIQQDITSLSSTVQSNYTTLNTNKVDKEANKSLILNSEIERLETLHNYDDTALNQAVNNLSNNKVDKVNGKSLISDSEITRLANVTNYDDTQIKQDITSLQTNKADKSQIPTVPTNVSAFNNDAGYLTEHQSLSNYYNKSEVDAKVSSVYRVCGSVASYSNLPTNAVKGDVYNVLDTGSNYVWTGTEWDKLSETVDLTPYLTKQEATLTYQPIGNYALKSEIPTVPTNISAFNNDSGYVDNTYHDNTKQDVISNLSTIESNASAGKSASDTISTYGDIVTHNASEFLTEHQDISGKQDKLTAGANIDITNNVISASGGKQMTFAITEDMVTVTTNATKGVAPYNTAYYYTNITINENAGIEWIEGAFYSFIVNTKMVVTSSYRNVRVRIGESGDWKPVMMYADALAGSSYFIKALNTSFQYKSVYQTNGALHKLTDSNTTYTLNQLVDQSIYVAGDGTYAITRYSIIMEKPNHTWEKITDTSKNYTTATTKTVNTNGFVLGHIRYYLNSATLTSGAKMGASYCAIQYSSVSFSYSTNCSTTPDWKTAQPVFLIGSLGADGLFYLDTQQWWGFTYPTENDGKLYIRIGTTVNTTDSAISFCQDKPIYYHDGTQLREYIVADNKQDTISDLATIRSGASLGATALQELPSDVAKTNATNTFTKPQVIQTDEEKGFEVYSSSSGGYLYVTRGGATPVQMAIKSGTSGGTFGTNTNHQFQFRTNNITRMTVGTDGSITLANDVASTSNNNQVATTKWVNNKGYITSSYHDSTKQDVLTSGTNIKTINGESIVGSGNVEIKGSAPIYIPTTKTLSFDGEEIIDNMLDEINGEVL